MNTQLYPRAKNHHAPALGRLTQSPLARNMLVAACLLLIPASAQAQTGSGRTRIDNVVRLTLRPAGFESSEITTRPGTLALTVRNRTFLPDLTVRLEREEGSGRQPVKSTLLDLSRPDWRDRLVVTPGTYVISVDGHPDWQAKLIVTAGGGN